MKGDLVEEFMEEYGSQVQIEYELQNFDGISMKTGTISLSGESGTCSVPSATSSTGWTISASAWVAIVGI
jgi:hypothetical protein